MDEQYQYKLLQYRRWLASELEICSDTPSLADDAPVMYRRGALGAYQRIIQAFNNTFMVKLKEGAVPSILPNLSYESMHAFLHKTLKFYAKNSWVREKDPEQHHAYMTMHKKFEKEFPDLESRIRKY
jgi:hypothetical protein